MAACSRGEITSCGCGTTNRRQPRVQASWKWAGCSVDLALGLRIARKFLDNREVEGDARALMNLHNNKAGRNVSFHFFILEVVSFYYLILRLTNLV